MEDLAAHYQVARGSVAQAIRQLETEGLVLSTPRRGTVVLEHRVRRRVPRSNKVHRRRARGYSFGATRPDEPAWVHHITPTYSVEPIPPRPAELLGVEPGTPVARRRRVTSPANEPPFALFDSWILPAVAAVVPQVMEQGVAGEYLQCIEEAGYGPLHWHEITRVRMPDKEEAELLGIPLRLPVQETYRVAVAEAFRHDSDAPALTRSQVVDVTSMIIPGDRIETITEIERDASAEWVQPLSPPGGPWSPKEV